MRIFVDNVAFDTSHYDLEELFGRYGRLSYITLATDRQSGRPRGFAFVDMPDTTEALAAIATLHGSSFAGHLLTVSKARW